MHSWCVIEGNLNDKLYVVVSDNDANPTTVVYVIVTIPPGNYVGATLARAIMDRTNDAIEPSGFPNLIVAVYNTGRNIISISTLNDDYKFKILTPQDIGSNLDDTWGGDPIDTINPQDINSIVGNLVGKSPEYTLQNPYVSSAINLQTVRNIYIHSSLGNHSTIGPRGETTIIKKVPVTANKGEMIFHQVFNTHDFGDCSKQSLRTINFEIKDARGNYIDFHGSNLSFSLIFSRT